VCVCESVCVCVFVCVCVCVRYVLSMYVENSYVRVSNLISVEALSDNAIAVYRSLDMFKIDVGERFMM
jgi:hypothetical protein